MKLLLTILTFLTLTVSYGQNIYSEDTHINDMSTGVYYQNGPGANNSDYSWKYSLGTKLTVNGNLARNFEITSVNKDNSGYAIRQFNQISDSWTTWRNLILDDGNGNVGIGTDSPSHPLEVNGSALFKNDTNDQDMGLGTPWGDNGIVFNANNQENLYRFNIANTKSTGKEESYFRLVYNVDEGAKNGLYIRKGGNVGIGTSNPVSELEVNGNIQLGYNQYLKGKRFGGAVSNLIGYSEGETTGHHVISISEYSTVPSEVKIYTPTDTNQGVGIYSDQIIAFFRNDGNVGIGTKSPQNKLSVNGTIWAKEVKVTLSDGADWVFDEDYDLKSLSEVEAFITKNKHLPEIPSAEEFRENDMKVSEMTNKLLQKIEELTLYTIQQEKEIEKLQAFKEKNLELESRLKKLEELLLK